jgi:hypothetical protein
VNLTAPKPAGLQFVTQTQTVPRQRGGAFRIRGHPVSRRFEDKSKLLAESLTIAREAAPAFEFHHTVDATLEPEFVSDPLGSTRQLDGLRELTRQAGRDREGRIPPGRVGFERKRSRRFIQSINRDFHALHRSQPAPAARLTPQDGK